MLSQIKLYIMGFLAAVAGFFMVKSKLQEREIEDLEEENAKEHRKNTIHNIVEAEERRAQEDEEAKKANIDNSDWRNNI